MVSIAGLASSGIGEDIRPMRIERRDTPRQSVANHFKCPIRWQAEEDRLVFQAADLIRPFASYNHELLDMLDRELRQQADGFRASETLTDQVR